jgi:hypothetical protein
MERRYMQISVCFLMTEKGEFIYEEYAILGFNTV